MTAEITSSIKINTKNVPQSRPIEVLGSGKEKGPIPTTLVLVPSPRIEGQMTLKVAEGITYRPGDTVFTFVGPVTENGDVYSFQHGPQKHINPVDTAGRNTAGHFLNHSCNPNVDAKPTMLEVDGNFVPGFTVTALEELKPGRELGADYATWEEHTVTDVPCLCGSDQCRGRVSGWDGLTPGQQAGLIERKIVAPYLAARYTAEQNANGDN